jgi:hypothetical protein
MMPAVKKLPVAAQTAPSELVAPELVVVEDCVRPRPGLTPRMRVATHALAEALFTTEDGPPPEARLAWLVDDLDDFLGRAGSRARLVYRLCLLAIAIVAPLMIGRFPPYRALSREQRTRALERMEKSTLGLAVFGAKAMLCILYYEHPDAARAIGHDGHCRRPSEARSIGEARVPQASLAKTRVRGAMS